MLELTIIQAPPPEKDKDAKPKPKLKEPKEKEHEDDLPKPKILTARLIFRRLLETIKDIVEECEISADNKGLSIQIMDSMQACIANFFIPASIFDGYRCDRSLIMGLKVKDLLEITKPLDTEKVYTFKLICLDDAKELKVFYECPEYNMKFDLTLYTFNITKYDCPEANYDAELETSSRVFMMLPNAIGKFADTIVIEALAKCIVFRQGGERVTSTFTLEENKETALNVSSEIKNEISMKYVRSMAKAAELSESVGVCMGRDKPVFFDFKIGEEGYMKFYVAPKCMVEE